MDTLFDSRPAPVATHLGFVAVLLLFVLLATLYSLLVPITQGEDELAHYRYLSFIAQTGRLPADEVEREQACPVALNGDERKTLLPDKPPRDIIAQRIKLPGAVRGLTQKRQPRRFPLLRSLTLVFVLFFSILNRDELAILGALVGCRWFGCLPPVADFLIS